MNLTKTDVFHWFRAFSNLGWLFNGNKEQKKNEHLKKNEKEMVLIILLKFKLKIT